MSLDDAHWPATARLIDQAIGAIVFTRFCYRGQCRQDLERTFFAHYRLRDERLPRLQKLLDGRLIQVSELYTDQEKKTLATNNESLAAAGCQNGLNVHLYGPQGMRMVWALADPVDRGGWESAQVDMNEGLVPHVRQFVRARQALLPARPRRLRHRVVRQQPLRGHPARPQRPDRGSQ